MKTRLVWSLCIPFAAALVSQSESFNEELTIRSLPDGRVASRFAFSTILAGATPRSPHNQSTEDEAQHYTLFPLTLGQILREYAVTELHLTLNAGKWNYDRWGYPDEDGVGTGAELWAWMGEGAAATIDERWRDLRNALAGLFCASLGSLDELRTTSPAFTFAPGALPDWPLPHAMRHASLPSEHVCTENLTPFLKLLPCKSLSGIASLLNPHRLFDADWHGMGLHVSWLPDEGVQVRLTFQTVTDPLRSNSNARDWSFTSMFDRTIQRACPVADSSSIAVSLPFGVPYSISPEPSAVEDGTAMFDVGQINPLDVALHWPAGFEYSAKPLSETPLSIRRTLKGSTQDNGALSVVIRNDEDKAVEIGYLETMPWIVQFYLHTMTLKVDGVSRLDLLKNISYTPPIPHSRATTFQAILELPPRSTVTLRMVITRAFLRYTEHPPDAERGWDLPPAVIVTLDADGQPVPGRRMYAPTLLVDLATPDFSMPYNVIIFTCSLIAFIFGSVFNYLTRKFVVLEVPVATEK
ncbi:GPI transamidase component GPI16 [Mycena kentingensis (nom. inval.)]|nr:GPI transamidase component GPI16 [Mycena kentingensis (nom. inval.)]